MSWDVPNGLVHTKDCPASLDETVTKWVKTAVRYNSAIINMMHGYTRAVCSNRLIWFYTSQLSHRSMCKGTQYDYRINPKLQAPHCYQEAEGL